MIYTHVLQRGGRGVGSPLDPREAASSAAQEALPPPPSGATTSAQGRKPLPGGRGRYAPYLPPVGTGVSEGEEPANLLTVPRKGSKMPCRQRSEKKMQEGGPIYAPFSIPTDCCGN
jgi:hypothetical protein